MDSAYERVTSLAVGIKVGRPGGKGFLLIFAGVC